MTDAIGLMKTLTKSADVPATKDMLRDLLTHHPHTYYHSIHVAMLSLQIADLAGLTGDRLSAVATGALLHDIGKLKIPPEILNKEGPLTDQEFNVIRKHPVYSYMRIMDSKSYGTPIVPLIGLMHHMRLDGSGYPAISDLPPGVDGSRIPTEAQIVAVADMYEAIVSPRSYKDSFSDLFAIGELYAEVTAARLNVRYVSILDSMINNQTLIMMHGGFRNARLAI